MQLKFDKIIFIFFISHFAFSQSNDDPILFGQQRAIKNITSQLGISDEEFDDYLNSRFNNSLSNLSKNEGAQIINELQNEVLTKSSISEALYSRTKQAPAANSIRTTSVKSELLSSPSVLEKGMKKLFHFKDGSISEGEILDVENNMVTLLTESGQFTIPEAEFLADIGEILNKKGEKFIGHVLSESDETFIIRTLYGDATVKKTSIEKMSRYYGGVLDKKTENTKRFYTGEAVLLSVFMDPTATPLRPNTFYISAISMGYGLTDRFMLKTKYGSSLNGDLNLHGKLRLFHRKTPDKERALSLGIGFHRAYPIKSVIGRFSHAIKVSGDSTLNQYSNINVDDVVNQAAENPVYAEAYAVYTSSRTNPTGRGKVGWSAGLKVSNAFVGRDDFLSTTSDYNFKWDDSYTLPYRMWLSLDYDLRKNLKFVASAWADNGYKTMDAGMAARDYFGSDGSAPLQIDSFEGTKSTIDFDFGLLYAVNENFRIGFHFQQPFLDIYWEFLEF